MHLLGHKKSTGEYPVTKQHRNRLKVKYKETYCKELLKITQPQMGFKIVVTS